MGTTSITTTKSVRFSEEFATDAESVDMDRVVSYCRQHTTEAEKTMNGLQTHERSMAQTDHESERARLREIARSGDTDERRKARRKLAALDRERHRDIYDKLATE
jgi:hypothetical protein